MKQIHLRVDDNLYDEISRIVEEKQKTVQDGLRDALVSYISNAKKEGNEKDYKFTYIDLFAGIGGMRIAYDTAGGKCVYSNEWDKYCQQTYFANFGDRPDVGAKKELDLLLRDDPALFDLFIHAILPDATFEDAYAWLDAAKKEPFKANSFHIEFDEPSKLPLYTATNRLGQTYIVKQPYLSYKKDLKPEAINPPQHGVRS